jgi:hypothetical protein
MKPIFKDFVKKLGTEKGGLEGSYKTDQAGTMLHAKQLN